MRGFKIAAVAAVLATCTLSSRADAAALSLGLGGDYWFHRGGAFELTLAVDTPIARHLSIGGRFGALIATDPNDLGVPLDFRLRARFSRLYMEGLVGPWIVFADDPVRAHAAFGFGLVSGSLTFGLELGYLSPEPIFGLRLAFRL